jgi:hypothetical protein
VSTTLIHPVREAGAFLPERADQRVLARRVDDVGLPTSSSWLNGGQTLGVAIATGCRVEAVVRARQLVLALGSGVRGWVQHAPAAEQPSLSVPVPTDRLPIVSALGHGLRRGRRTRGTIVPRTSLTEEFRAEVAEEDKATEIADRDSLADAGTSDSRRKVPAANHRSLASAALTFSAISARNLASIVSAAPIQALLALKMDNDRSVGQPS